MVVPLTCLVGWFSRATRLFVEHRTEYFKESAVDVFAVAVTVLRACHVADDEFLLVAATTECFSFDAKDQVGVEPVARLHLAEDYVPFEQD